MAVSAWRGFPGQARYLSASEAGLRPNSDISSSLNAFAQKFSSSNIELILDEQDSSYTLSSDVTLSENITVSVLQGSKISPNSGTTLTINGSIQAGNYQIFDGDGDIKIRGVDNSSIPYIDSINSSSNISPFQGPLNPLWFAGDDIGAKINAAFATGGGKTHVIVPSGEWSLTETIDMGEDVGSHLVLEGSGNISTTLRMPASSVIVGVDCSTSDESTVCNIRVVEATGARTCACLRPGGTSLTLDKVWFGNARYGLLQNKGAGTHLNNAYIENCDFNVLIGANYKDASIGVERGSSVSNCRYINLFSNGGGSGLEDFTTGTHGITVDAFRVLNVFSVSGSIRIGATLTVGGRNSIVYDYDATEDTITVGRFDNSPIAGSFTTSSGGSGTINSVTGGQVVKDLQFTALQGLRADDSGLFLGLVRAASVQGHFRENNTGIIVDSYTNHSINLNGCTCLDNTDTGINWIHGEGTVSGCSSGSTVGTTQAYGYQWGEGKVSISALSAKNNGTAATNTTGAITIEGSLPTAT